MGMLTIMEKDASCVDDINWPLFYMNDFSISGLLVKGLGRSLQALEADGYRLIRSQCSAKVIFENRERLQNIFETLTGNGIEFESADLVGCAYQG